MTAETHERAAMRALTWRILPLLFAGYFTAYIDRVNVGFAALTMNHDLGLSAEQYGLAAGLFFAGYVAFSIPSNLILAKIGGRTWLPIIMACWGSASLLNAWVFDAHSFYVLRFILGVGEAGLYPGLLYILAQWFPGKYRVRMLTLLILSTPFSIVVGSLISQPILLMDGFLDHKGWQWLFILQALPTIGLAAVFWFCLPDSPQDARWLKPDVKAWLIEATRQRTRRPRTGAEIQRPRCAHLAHHLGLRHRGCRHQRRRLWVDPVPAANDQCTGREQSHDPVGQCHSLRRRLGGDGGLGHSFRSQAGAQLARFHPRFHRRHGADLMRRAHRSSADHGGADLGRDRRILLRLGILGGAFGHADRLGRRGGPGT